MAALTLAASAQSERLPIFDDHDAFDVHSFEVGRVWVEQEGVTYLCALAPAQSPAAVVLRACQPLVTPSLHYNFSVAQAAAEKVQDALEDAEEGAAPEAETSHLEEEVADLEAFTRAVAALSDQDLAEKMLEYSRDLAALSGQACLLEPAEMAPANAINAGQLLFLEFGVVTSASDAVTLPMGMELEARNYLQHLRHSAVTLPGHDQTVARIDALHDALRQTRQRLRSAAEQLLRDGRHAYQGRSVKITGCA